MSLFPQDLFGGSGSSGAGAGAASGGGARKPLVQFRAGRMNQDGTWVRPDTRKGLVILDMMEDGLVHFMWKDRASNLVEEDLIIFPQDAEYKHVPQCTTGRVFMLHFASSSRKLFFWMQEPKSDKDSEYCEKINNYINNPPDLAQLQQPSPAAMPGLGRGGAGGRLGDPNMLLQQLLSGGFDFPRRPAGQASQQAPAASTPQQPAQPAAPASTSAGAAPAESATAMTTAATAAAPPAASAAAAAPNLNDLLQSMLANIQVPPSAHRQEMSDADLGRILTPENIAPLLQDQTVQQRLFPFLPERAERTREELEEIIRSPQFRQAIVRLNHALQSGQLAPLMSQLGLDPVVGGPMGGVEAFIAAIRQQAERRRNTGSGGSGSSADRMDTD